MIFPLGPAGGSLQFCFPTSKRLRNGSLHSAALVLLSSDAFMARRTSTEINLADRMIRRRYEVCALAWHRVYSLDDYATAEIKVKGQVIEGYSLLFFRLILLEQAGISRYIRQMMLKMQQQFTERLQVFWTGPGYRHKSSKPDNI